MYKAHFSLRESPFGITPDTSFFFACDAHQEALNTLLVAVRNGEGFVKITGEVGPAKTLLCRKFLASLGDGFISAYIPNPYLEPRALLLALADELGWRWTRTSISIACSRRSTSHCSVRPAMASASCFAWTKPRPCRWKPWSHCAC